MLLPLYFMGQLFEDIRKRVLFVNPWELFEHQRSARSPYERLVVNMEQNLHRKFCLWSK